MALFGRISTVKKQVPHGPAFAAGFAYLQELFRLESSAAARIRALAAGETHRVELAGGAYAMEQVYRSKPRAEGVFESHLGYIDVQVIFEGEELMEVADIGRGFVTKSHHADRDVIFYKDMPGSSVLHLRVGEAAVFFPEDVHMPGLHAASGPVLVRKTVVKVPVSREGGTVA